MAEPAHEPAASTAPHPDVAPDDVTPSQEPSDQESIESSAIAPIEEPLLAELPTFELFFKTFGFKRVHGRVWGLLVLAGQPLSSRDICEQLGMAQGTASVTLNELAEWGAISSTFDTQRRCHLHAPVGNALSIVATVFRRREQVVFQQFRGTAQRSLDYITEHKGERDPRVLTLRSILTTCDIAEAMMQLVFNAVQSAMADPESVLSKAIHAAFRVGVGLPTRILFPKAVQDAVTAESIPTAESLPTAGPPPTAGPAAPRSGEPEESQRA